MPAGVVATLAFALAAPGVAQELPTTGAEAYAAAAASPSCVSGGADACAVELRRQIAAVVANRADLNLTPIPLDTLISEVEQVAEAEASPVAEAIEAVVESEVTAESVQETFVSEEPGTGITETGARSGS
ncbi:MAG: hypothetical protein KI785_13605 [Devosiaceae bacterium]|nr:hypothetical protein [Devosiaceae bacterium MH13]